MFFCRLIKQPREEKDGGCEEVEEEDQEVERGERREPSQAKAKNEETQSNQRAQIMSEIRPTFHSHIIKSVSLNEDFTASFNLHYN